MKEAEKSAPSSPCVAVPCFLLCVVLRFSRRPRPMWDRPSRSCELFPSTCSRMFVYKCTVHVVGRSRRKPEHSAYRCFVFSPFVFLCFPDGPLRDGRAT